MSYSMTINDPFPPNHDNLITVANCAEWQRVLEQVVAQLEQAGVRVPKSGRLRRAIDTIERAARAGAHPTAKRDQLAFAHAMSDAADFFDIGHILPSQLTTQLVGELRTLMKGQVGRTSQDGSSQRFQSQFWLGTILHRGGYRPQVPQGLGNRAPDYLIEEGTMVYGVEIKRPDTARSAESALVDASKQLQSYGVKGCVILDLSSAAALQELSWVPREEAASIAESAKGRFISITRRLGEIASREYSTSNSAMRNVLYVFYLGRTFSWIEGAASGLTIVAMAAGGAFVRPRKDLEYHHTIDTAERINQGLRHAGFSFERFRAVAKPPQEFPLGWKV
jgi:hypothetical protein